MPVFFGWLSCKILVRRLPKANNWFFNLIFCSHIHSPKRREIVPPHTIGRGQFSSQNLPLSPTLYFGWLSYVFSSIGGRPRPPIVFFHFPFPESNFHPKFVFHELNCQHKRWLIALPQHSAVAKSCKKYPSLCWCCFLVGCCIGWARGGRLRLTPGSSLSLSLPHSPPKTTGKSPLHGFHLGDISSSSPPLHCSQNLADCWCPTAIRMCVG